MKNGVLSSCCVAGSRRTDNIRYMPAGLSTRKMNNDEQQQTSKICSQFIHAEFDKKEFYVRDTVSLTGPISCHVTRMD
jgi:hypothetical protein